MTRRKPGPQPWEPSRATKIIRALAKEDGLNIATTRHCRERLDERALQMGDVLHVLKNGNVYEAPEKSTHPHFYKYRMECETPNSNSRIVRVVVIPDPASCTIKVVTIMWLDG